MAGFSVFHGANNTGVGYPASSVLHTVPSSRDALGCRNVDAQRPNRDCVTARQRSRAHESCDSGGGFGEFHLGLLAALGEGMAYAVVKVLVEQV
jgi:hypothetical protein